MVNLLKALFIDRKTKYQEPEAMTKEARDMLAILDMCENNRVEKKHFINAGIYNPGRAKSQLVRKHDKVVLCKRENKTSYRMYITDPTEARNNMTEKERKLYTREHLYNLTIA